MALLCSLSSLNALDWDDLPDPASDPFDNLDFFDDPYAWVEDGPCPVCSGTIKLDLPDPPESGIYFEEDYDSVIIGITDITAQKQELETTLNESNDRLSIITPENRIFITVHGNTIDVETSRKKKETRKQDENNDALTAQSNDSSSSSISQTVSSKLQLSKQEIDYNECAGALIVYIPKEGYSSDDQ